MSLYTKYRPKDWDELIGQDAICTILKTSLRTGKVGHAYIFTGSRGTGKTSSARIFAKGINCSDLQDGNPCHKCKNCLDFDAGKYIDVIELDAASHTQVEKMRQLIEEASFAPNQGKYKVYIIDEVHMLSDSSFNALLKTLEEPPAHVKFILATTEIHKVPETVRSRTLRFDFGRVPTDVLFSHLKKISEYEGVSAEESALKMIARAARGGVRDALTLLEQNTVDGSLLTEQVMATLSLVDETLISSVVSVLYGYESNKLENILKELKTKHIEVQGFFDGVLYFLRDRLIENVGKQDFHRYEEILNIFQSNYRDIKFIPDGMLLIELTLLRACQPLAPLSHTDASPKIQSTQKQKTPDIQKEVLPIHTKIQETAQKNEEKPKREKEQSEETLAKKENKKENEVQSKTTETPIENFSYRRLLDALKSHSGLVFALKSASFSQDDTLLSLSFTSNWNYEQVTKDSSKTLIQSTLGEVFGGQWTLECHIKPKPDTSAADEIFV